MAALIISVDSREDMTADVRPFSVRDGGATRMWVVDRELSLLESRLRESSQFTRGPRRSSSRCRSEATVVLQETTVLHQNNWLTSPLTSRGRSVGVNSAGGTLPLWASRYRWSKLYSLIEPRVSRRKTWVMSPVNVALIHGNGIESKRSLKVHLHLTRTTFAAFSRQ